MPQDIEVDVDTITTPTEGRQFRVIDALRELARMLIALLLLLLLVGEVVYSFNEIHHINAKYKIEDKADAAKRLMDILNIVISPTVALFGAATGYYYGSRTRSRD